MRRPPLIVAAALALGGTTAWALVPQLLDEEPVPPTASATVSKLEVTLGEPFALFVTVAKDAEIDVNLPGHLELSDAFEAGAWTSSDRTQPDGTVRRDYEIAVTAWELGDLMMPPVPVTWSARGRSGVVITNPVQLRVIGSIAGETGELRGDARPVTLDSRDWTLVWIAAGIGGAIAVIVAIAVWLYLRRRRRGRARKVRVGDGPPVAMMLHPADDAALRALDALAASGALELEELTPTFAAMVEIIRTYITRRFGVPAHELTTTEMVEALAEVPGARAAAPLIRPWFRVCDLVRYAHARVDQGDAKATLEEARRIVVETAKVADA